MMSCSPCTMWLRRAHTPACCRAVRLAYPCVGMHADTALGQQEGLPIGVPGQNF